VSAGPRRRLLARAALGLCLAAAAGGSALADDADDRSIDPVEPDFSVITLPTTLRLPRHALAFRLTHRFTRGLEQGDFGDLAADLFGFDGGAQVGLELRFGVTSKLQLGVYRISDRTIDLFAQHELLRQGKSPLGLAVAASVEGLDNFHEEYSPRAAVVASRRLGERAVLYAQPAFLWNTQLSPELPGEKNDTLVLGLGARLRMSDGAYLVAEVTPRLAGYAGNRGSGDPGTQAAFGIEGRVGGHVFQFNVSNIPGTTPAQTARGRQGRSDWYIGFNLSRKFY
jgi:Membrane bound beta barrel domain (DUF5777)